MNQSAQDECICMFIFVYFLLKASFQDLPFANWKSLSCAEFLTRLPLPFLILRLFLLPLFPLPSFPVVAWLVSSLLDEFATFLKDAGKFIWKAPLSTCLSKSLNLRTLLFTCVHAMLACSHDLNHLWTLRPTANRNFSVKNLSRAIWLQKGFLLCPTRSSSWLSFSMQKLSLPKNMDDAVANSWSWVPRPTKSLGTYTVCFSDSFDIIHRLFLTLFLD